MQRNKTDIYPLTIEKIVYHGYGLGTHEGLKVFVPNVVPGDKIEFIYTKIKRTFGEGKCVNIITPSSDRTTPACSHYPTCGGCQLMDISYQAQCTFKEEMISDAIKQFLPEIAAPSVIPSPKTTYYRNKMEFSFGLAEDKLVLGLKKRGSYKDVISVPNCLLQSKETNTLVSHVESFFQTTDLKPWSSREQQGTLRTLAIREEKQSKKKMVILGVSTLDDVPTNEFRDCLSTFDSIASIYIQETREQKGTPTTSKLHHIAGDPHLYMPLGEYTFQLSPDSFFQTNTFQTEPLYDAVKWALPDHCKGLDLYCGTGTIGLYCSSKLQSIIGIEEVENAILNAKENAILNGINNAKFHVGRVKNILKFTPIDCDAIIVDPPRSGMTPKALKRMLALDASTIVYVSCNPMTLLRDLKEALASGYSINTFKAFDMFPHTYHIECVVKLTKSY